MTQTLFMHIHKCGGSTLRYMLDAVYPYGVQYPAPMDYKARSVPYRTQAHSVPQVMGYLQDTNTSDFQLFMGHYDWQIVACLDGDTTILTMLRNPVAQLYSQFRYFWVDTKYYKHYKLTFETSGFEGFIQHDAVYQFANHQTRFLGGRFWNYAYDDLNNGVLTNAKRNLKRCTFGLVERWGESIALFEQTLGVKLPVISVQNSNQKYRDTPLSDDMIARVQNIQKYDVSLYEYAQKRFEEQF